MHKVKRWVYLSIRLRTGVDNIRRPYYHWTKVLQTVTLIKQSRNSRGRTIESLPEERPMRGMHRLLMAMTQTFLIFLVNTDFLAEQRTIKSMCAKTISNSILHLCVVPTRVPTRPISDFHSTSDCLGILRSTPLSRNIWRIILKKNFGIFFLEIFMSDITSGFKALVRSTHK